MERKWTFKFSAMVERHDPINGGAPFYIPVIRWNPHADNRHYPATVLTPFHPFENEPDAVTWLRNTILDELSGPPTRWTDR